ncbi:MAG: SGNH/GDSL hydrolase family protein [Fibrobacteria bacterium]
MDLADTVRMGLRGLPRTKDRWKTAILVVAMSASAIDQAMAAVDVPANDPNIQYFGRFDMADALKPRCDWPGSAIQARFTGTSITVKISGGQNDFNVIIDGQWKSKLTVDGKTVQVAASGLAEGTHTLLLAKRTEGFQGISTFAGFQLEDGKALVAPPARPARKILFIGDSYTVGYGDEANTLTCSDRRPFDNNYVAYGPVTARAVDAEYSVQAVSGYGMLHNYGDTNPQSSQPMPSVFDRTLFSAASPKWDMSKWIPDLIVIALGSNDFSTAVKPSEAQYAAAYADFLGKIRGWFPNAQILCMTYSVDNLQKKYVDSVVARATAKGDAKIHRVHMPALPTSDLGCDYHPNVAGQQKYSDALLPSVKQYLGVTSSIAPQRYNRKGAAATQRSGSAVTFRIPMRGIAGPMNASEHPDWVDARGRFLPLRHFPGSTGH